MPEAHSSAGRSAAGRVADGSRRQPTAAPPPPSPQRRLILSPSPSHSPSLIPNRRDMLPRTGRSCALMCDITPDNARQEMLHARPRRDSLQVRPRRLRLQLGQRRRAPAQWRLLYDASPGATRPGHPSSQKVAEVDTRV